MESGQAIWQVLILAALFVAIFIPLLANYSAVEERLKLALSEYASHLYERLDRMFMRQSLTRCYVMILVPTVLISLTLYFSVLKVLGPVTSLFAGALGAVIGYRMARWTIDSMFWRRVRRFDDQLVDILNMMSNSLKSGLSFLQVMNVIEREMKSPACEEFRLVLQENRLGVTLDDALRNLAARIPSDDLFMMVNSVVTLRETGGDLTETFETIAYTLRERHKIRGKIRTLTAQGLFQTMVICALPFLMLFVMYLLQPEVTVLMWTTPLGIALLGLMIALEVVGAYVMKRILTIDI